MNFTDLAYPPRYLILDTESVPDGQLLAKVKYSREELTPEQAVAKAQAEAKAQSSSGSDFLPVTFHLPVAACVLAVGPDLEPQSIQLLDAPRFRSVAIAETFWQGLETCRQALGGGVDLVTFNGKGFDLPLLEMAAFRFGIAAASHFDPRQDTAHLDLMDWLTNSGAFRLAGGLNLLSKILGKPGKMETTGGKIYPLFLEGKFQEINDYCLFDTLDTYFVFLRTRVMTGELPLSREHDIVLRAKHWLREQITAFPGLTKYIDNWGDWKRDEQHAHGRVE